MALTACSSTKKGDDAVKESPAPVVTTTAAAPAITEAQAKGSLLVGSDLPSGYTQDKEYTHDELPGGCAGVDAAIAAEKTAAPTYVVSSFDKGDNGFSIDEEIGIFTDAAEAKSILDAYTTGFATCPSWKATQQGMSATFNIKNTGAPSLGDEAKTFTLTASANGQSFGGTENVVLVGNTLVFVDEGGPESERSDPAVDLDALTSKLIDRLKQAS